MSQGSEDPTGTHNFENQFGDDNEALKIQSPGDYYGYQMNNTGNRFSMMTVILGGVAIFVTLAGVVYLAYTKGVQDGQKNLPPLVMADQQAVKIIPKDNLRGDISKENLSIYKTIEGNPAPHEPASPEPQNTPIQDVGDGSVEKLYSANPEADTSVEDYLAELDATLETDSVSAPEPTTEPEQIKQAPPLSVAAPVSPPQPNPSAADGKIYIVQISASRSIAQTKTAFSGLQRKFPDLFKSRALMVQKAELGEKGIFFRLGVGGFANRQQAKNFCASLKARGQDCLVRKIN